MEEGVRTETRKECPACGGKLERRSRMYYWRGVFMHGWVCDPCDNLHDVGKAFLLYVDKVARRYA